MSRTYNAKLAAAQQQAESRVRDHRQTRFSDVPVFPPLPTYPRRSELKKLRFLRHLRYAQLQSMGVNGFAFGRPGVPVTSPYAAKHTYHIVQLQKVKDGPIVQFACREADGYTGGWRVLMTKNDSETEPWFECKGFHLPRDIFVNVVKTEYSYSYQNINSIGLSKAILSVIFDFFVSTRGVNPLIITAEGTACLDAVFFILGEGQRFLHFLKLTGRGLRSIKPVFPSQDEATVVTLWRQVCEAILAMCLALVEMHKGLGTEPRDIRRFGYTYRTARGKLVQLNQKCNGLLRFIGPNTEINLEYLCGGDMLLLKHRPEYVNKILMRLDGFTGVFSGTKAQGAEGETSGEQGAEGEASGDSDMQL
ncbi:hypothetical protein VPH35_028122 [Triticum aestivum]|nr:uncharacterized protein LOC123044410 isoform X1 [Triticum aestivum]